MPATRVFIFERQRLIESRLRPALDQQPVEIRPLRGLDDLKHHLAQATDPLTFVEHSGLIDDTVAAVLRAGERGMVVVVVTNRSAWGENHEAIRVAGAMAVIRLESLDQPRNPLVRGLVARSQERLMLAGGKRPASVGTMDGS